MKELQRSSPRKNVLPTKEGPSSLAGGWLPSPDDFLKLPYIQYFDDVPRSMLEALTDEHVTCLAMLSLLKEQNSKKELRLKEIETVELATKAVSKQYRKSSAKFHPDRFGDTFRNEHERLQAAYDVLKDKDLRRYYINSMCEVFGYIHRSKKTNGLSKADEASLIYEAHMDWIKKNEKHKIINPLKTPGTSTKPTLKISGGISTRTPKRMILRSIPSRTSVQVAFPALEPLHEFYKACRQIKILSQDGADHKTIKTIVFGENQEVLAENHYIETLLTLQPGVHQLAWFAVLELREGSLTETPHSMATEVTLGRNDTDSLLVGKDLVFLARRRAGELRSVLSKQRTPTSIDEINQRMFDLHHAVSRAHTIKSRLTLHLRANGHAEDTPELDKLQSYIHEGNLEMSRLIEQKEVKTNRIQTRACKQRLADKLEHGEGAAWMASVTAAELESINGSSNRLFQFLTEGKKAKSLSIDPETLNVASSRKDLFTDKQCEKICEVYLEAEEKFAEEAQKSLADEQRKRTDEELRQSIVDDVPLMPFNAPVVLINLVKDQALNRSMGTYEGKAPHGRHRVRLYKDNRLLSLKEENICRYEDFLAEQDRANYENYENDVSNSEEKSDEEDSVGDEDDVVANSLSKTGDFVERARTEGRIQPGFSLIRRVLSVPSSQLGFLIGRKRATRKWASRIFRLLTACSVRHIEVQTGIASIVINKDVVDGKQDVVISGEKGAVEKAEKLCMDILKVSSESKISLGKEKESLSPSRRHEKDVETVTIPVPQLLVSELIGRKGSNLRRMTKISRVSRVTLLDPPLDGGVRQARIVGSPTSVKKAINLIESFCELKMPGYKTRYGLTSEGCCSQHKEENVVLEKDSAAFIASNEAVDHLANTSSEESVDPLLAFLLSQRASIKGSPYDFYTWLLQEDVVSMNDLAEAVEDDDFVHQQMQAKGLKGFKRTAFVKAIQTQLITQPCASGDSKENDKVPPELECPISHVLMVSDPVVASDGNVYERSAIEAWFLRSQENGSAIVRSPLTNEVLPNLILTSVSAVRTMAREFSSRIK